MGKLRVLVAIALALAPEWVQRQAYGGRRVTVDGRTIDWSALAVGQLALAIRPPDAEPVLEESRQGLRLLSRKLDLPCPPQVSRKDITLPGAAGPLPVRIYDTDLAARNRPAILFLHGGGWVQGGIDTHDGLCGQLALEAGVRVIAPEYRLAPEAKWPAAPDDVRAIWQAILADHVGMGIDPGRLAVGGDSAGGNLSAVLIHDLAEAGATRRPAAQLLIYPALDAGFATPSMQSLRDAYLLPRKRMEWYVEQYLPDGADHADPRVAPARSAHAAASPPTLILTAGHDPLRDDGAQHAERLRAAGVAVACHEVPGQIHAFMSIRRAVPEGRAALSHAAAWLRQALAVNG